MSDTHRDPAFAAIYAKLQATIANASFARRTYRPNETRQFKRSAFPRDLNRSVWLQEGRDDLRDGEKGAGATVAPKRHHDNVGAVLFWVRRAKGGSDDDLAGLLNGLKVEVEQALEAVELDQMVTVNSWSLEWSGFEPFEDETNLPPYAGGEIAIQIEGYS